MAEYLIQRGKMWVFMHRVPVDYRDFDRRGFVFESTKIKIDDDPKGRRAGRVVDALKTALEAYWHGLARGDAAAAKARYDAARARARRMGLEYREAAEIAADSSVTDLHNRIALLERMLLSQGVGVGVPASKAGPSAGMQTDAAMGGVPRVTIALSSMVEAFEAAKKLEVRFKSENQARKWKNPLVKAVKNLITVVGDMDLSALKRPHVTEFHTWWEDRVVEEGIQPETANKDFTHLQSMFRTLNKKHQWGLDDMTFSGIRFSKKANGQAERPPRPPYSVDYLTTRFLVDGAFDKLNAEARWALFVIIETGMRPSEVVNLRRNRVQLDAEIPFLGVYPDGRELKNRNSRRDIPLVGVARAAIEAALAAIPPGEERVFPRYHDKEDTWSANVNKFLSNNDLRETPDHTAYSIRHSFKTRLRQHITWGRSDQLIDLMMGHEEQKEKYGIIVLEQKLKWMNDIMFKTWPQRL